MLSDRETKGLTVLDSMTGRDISCLWNCYSLFAQREFIEALQEFSENFQRSNESDWSVPGGYRYNCMFQGFTVLRVPPLPGGSPFCGMHGSCLEGRGKTPACHTNK